MPVDYQCHDCGLQFSVGSLRMPSRSEYCGAMYLTCRACGTWHLALYSAQGRLGDRLLAQPKPQIKRPKAGHSPMVPAETWIVVEPPGAARNGKSALQGMSLRSWVGVRTRYSALICGHCHEKGTLVAAVRGTTCPHCKKQALQEWLSYAT